MASQNAFLVATIVASCLGILILTGHRSALAQNEPEPDETPVEQPHAEPTEFIPITAGDVERGNSTSNPEAAASPEEKNTSAAASTPTPAGESAGSSTPIAASEARSEARSLPTPEQDHKASKGAGPNIVPENSPFAGLNFSNQKGPTHITSDTGSLDYQHKMILFNGHVHAVQAGGDLTSDQLKVQYGNDFNDIRMMYADGNVRMSQGTRWITSDHAVLDQSTHILTFFGNPVAHDQKDQITGSTIKVDLVSGKSTVDKPRVIIFPREGKNPDNVDAFGSP